MLIFLFYLAGINIFPFLNEANPKPWNGSYGIPLAGDFCNIFSISNKIILEDFLWMLILSLSLNCCIPSPFKPILRSLATIPREVASFIYALCRVKNSSTAYVSKVIEKKNGSDRINEPISLVVQESHKTLYLSQTQLEHTKKESNLLAANCEKAVLTDDQIDAIKFYSAGDNYYDLNAGFVNKRYIHAYLKINEDLKAAITKLNNNELIKTFRGDHGNYFYSVSEGALWQPNKFLSTSKKSNIAYSFANGRCFIVAFGRRAGADISAISLMPEEQEFLYNKDTQFRVVFKHEYSKRSKYPIDKMVATRKNPIQSKYQIIEEAGLPSDTGQINGLIDALSLAMPEKKVLLVV